MDHEVVACNQMYLKYSGKKSFIKLQGLTDHNLPWLEYTDIYHQHEKDALNGKIYNAIQPSRDSLGRDFIAFDTKLPRLDNKKNIIGIVSLTIEIINPSLFKICNLLDKKR